MIVSQHEQIEHRRHVFTYKSCSFTIFRTDTKRFRARQAMMNF